MATYEQRVLNAMSVLTVGCIAVAALIGAWFGWKTGSTAVFFSYGGAEIHKGWLYAATNVLADMMQIGFAMLFAWAFFAKGWDWRTLILRAFCLAGSGVFYIMLTSLSWTSITGFAVHDRETAAAGREFASEEKDRLQRQLQAARENMPKWTTETQIYQGKPSAALEQEIIGMQFDRRWKASGECAARSATTAEEQAFCKKLSALRSAKETAVQTEANTKAIAELGAKLHELGATINGDGQASVIAGLTGGADEKAGRETWAKSWAFILESLKLSPALSYLYTLLLRQQQEASLRKPISARKPRAAGVDLAAIPASAVDKAEKKERDVRRHATKKRLGSAAAPDAPNVYRLGFDVRNAVKDAIRDDGRLYVIDAAPILSQKLGIDADNKTAIGRLLRPIGEKKRDSKNGGATYYQVA